MLGLLLLLCLWQATCCFYCVAVAVAATNIALQDAADISPQRVNNMSQKSTPIGHNSVHKSQSPRRSCRQRERGIERGRGRQARRLGLIECIRGGVAAHASSAASCLHVATASHSSLLLGWGIYLHCGLDFTFKGYDVVVSTFHYLLLPAEKGLPPKTKAN